MSSLFDELMEEICEKNQKISDLEAKLAEKDKAIENWQTMYESVVQTCHNDKEEIERLNKQLAEKEKEIESLKVDGVLNEELEEKDYTIIKPFLKETLTIEKIKHIIKNLSDFNLQQTSFHDIQKNDVMFNAYINKHIAYKKCLDLLDLVDQDKIPFCIEHLEKVRETAECVLDNALKNSSLNESYYDRLLDEIDNQIKQLKEMK